MRFRRRPRRRGDGRVRAAARRSGAGPGDQGQLRAHDVCARCLGRGHRGRTRPPDVVADPPPPHRCLPPKDHAMTENLAQLFLARADERPDLRIGTVDEQLTLPDASAARRRRCTRTACTRARRRSAGGLVATSRRTIWWSGWRACWPVCRSRWSTPPIRRPVGPDDGQPRPGARLHRPARRLLRRPTTDPSADREPRLAQRRPGGHARCAGGPIRPGVVHAHLRHHRGAEVLRADAQLLPAPRPRHRRRHGTDRGRTGCSPRCRCSTSTRSDTASSAPSPPAPTLSTVAKFSASGFWPARARARHHGDGRCTPRRWRSSSGPPRPRTPPVTACARCSTPTASS